MAPYTFPPHPGQRKRNDLHPVVLPDFWDTEKWATAGSWRQNVWFLDWLLRPHVYLFMSPYVFGIWLMYVGFLLGGIFFTIGSFAGCTPKIYRTSPQNMYEYYYEYSNSSWYVTDELRKDGMKNAYDWLVLFTYEFGSVAWVISMFGGIWESMNDDYHHRKREWENSGKQGSRPWFRWLWITPTNGRWYGAWIYMTGCIAYLVAASALVWQTKQDSRFLTQTEYIAMVNKMYLLGGITFFCAAPFYIWSWIDSTVVGGIVPLPGRIQLGQAKWWAWFIYFWSGAAFFSGGVCYMFMYAVIYPADEGKFTGRFTFLEFQEITGIAFGIGSLGYTFGSFFALAWTCELALSYEAELKHRAANGGKSESVSNGGKGSDAGVKAGAVEVQMGAAEV